MWKWLKRLFLETAAPIALDVTPTTRATMRISEGAMAEIQSSNGGAVLNPWTVAKSPPWLNAELAMDRAPGAAALGAMYNWAALGAFSEGLGFLGYPYLAELSQRGEYRRMVEIIASQLTRKWIKLRGGDPERLAKIHDAMKRFGIQARMREAMEHDGFFGRAQVFVDLGHALTDMELRKPLLRSSGKIGVGKIKNFKVVEPFWSYPGLYNSTNPLAEDFYAPRYWQVQGAQIHTSRLINFCSRPVPDILKPAYQFGGLALTQMAKPYVDNWIRTRQSVSDLVHSFSMVILATDMSTFLSGGGSESLIKRVQAQVQFRDNRNIHVINKETEELSNITTPLSGLEELQAQSQEQMSSISGIPLVIYLGVTPAGLNASSDGEIQVFYDNMAALQERVLRNPIEDILVMLQLDLDGIIDETIQFDFEPLAESDESEEAANRKSDADMDVVYVEANIVSPEEVRERLSNDEKSPYHGLNLSSTPPPEVDDGEDDNDDKKMGVAQDFAAVRAAGIMFTLPDGRVLFIKRSPAADDAPGTWGFPGGGIEQGESLADTARRETFEEVGYMPGNLGEPIDIRGGFAMFRVDLDEPFAVALNDEHTEALWTAIVPEPCHPTLAKAIADR